MARITSLLVIVMVIGLVAACGKKDATAANVSDEAIKQYILNNPEVIVESLTRYQQQMSEISDEEVAKQLSAMEKDVYQNPNSPVFGNPKGKTVIVEFFDYNCGFCKKMVPDLVRLTEENKDIKVILKELPVLGDSSRYTALAALVVHDIAPKKYFAFHSALMSHDGPQNEESLRMAAQKADVDANTIILKMKDKKYSDILNKNEDIARALKINGTPSFIVNGKMVRGAAGYEGLKEVIAAK